MEQRVTVHVEFQFTPLREGRQRAIRFITQSTAISIHAPPRGATSWRGRTYWHNAISIHAPPRGATFQHMILKLLYLFQFTPLREGRRLLCSCPAFRPHFNSRPSARGDLEKTGIRLDFDISIHAPPRGATTWVFPFWKYPHHFNSRPSARGDAGAWRVLGVLESYFNSRPSARGDDSEFPPREEESISIHAPPRGATHPEHLHSAGRFDFNSRPSARGDRGLSLDCYSFPFQFTPLREGRRKKTCEKS